MSKPISIRLDDHTLRRLKAAAERADVGWQTLVKLMIATQLAAIEAADTVEIPEGTRRRTPRAPRPQPIEETPPEDPREPSGLSQEDEEEIFSQLG